MNAFEGYLLKQHLTGSFSATLSKLAARSKSQKHKTRVRHAKAAKNPSEGVRAFLGREATRTTQEAQTKGINAAGAGFKRTGSEAAEAAMKMGKGSKAALLAAILAAGGTATALGAKAYKRSRPTAKASAKEKLMELLKSNKKKALVAGLAGGAAGGAGLAALASRGRGGE